MEITFILLYSVAFLALVVASYTDLKTREVPDWLNYSVMAVGIGLRALFSVYYSDPSYIIAGLLGLGLFVAIGLAMFYTGQWGGGDSKMLMALGSLFGITLDTNTFMLAFFVNLLLAGAAYGLIYSIALALQNQNAFVKEYRQQISKYRNIHYIFIAMLAVVLILFFSLQDPYLRLLVIGMASFAVTLFIVWIFVKAVEKACMLSYVEPKILTEGDWVAQEVKYRGKIIAGPKDLGVSKEQIAFLSRLYRQKKIKKVLLKQGIPFVPSFLIAFIATLVWGNLLMLLTGLYG